MHPSTTKLLRAHPALSSCPLLLALLDLAAAVSPSYPTSERELRRAEQMRLLRQWQRLEEAVAAFAGAGLTDDALRTRAPWGGVLHLVAGTWEVTCPSDGLRGTIADFIADVVRQDAVTHPFFAPNPSGPLRAPTMLERQFDVILTQSAPTHSMLDKFLRGSLKTATVLSQIVAWDQDHDGDVIPDQLIDQAQTALVEQGFTR